MQARAQRARPHGPIDMSVRKARSSDAATGDGSRRFSHRGARWGRPGRHGLRARWGRHGRPRMARSLLFAVAAVALGASLLFAGPVPIRTGLHKAVARTRSPVTAVPATVTISGRATATFPRSFLGLSMEYWSVPSFQRPRGVFDRVLSLLRVPGDGPVALRIGGDSADRTFPEPNASTPARWMFAVTPAWFRALRSVVRSSGAHVILDLNLVTGSAPLAAELAREAEVALPPHSIAGFEVGNEPDIYDRRYWMGAISSGRSGVGALPSGLTASSYIGEFHGYESALSQIAPDVPLIGPVVANPRRNLSWIAAFLAAPHAGLGIVSVHRYPYSACARKSSPTYPTIARVLSENASAGVARSIEPAVALARRAGLPLRLTELNSVTCGGLSGVSNTFATALWAPDTLFELLRAHVDGVNIHVRQNAINAAFLMGAGGLRARPLLYGLSLFARSLGPGAQLVNAHVQGPSSLHFKAWAVRLRGAVLHVLLIDKGPYPVRVDLRAPGVGPAQVQRLLAPSVRSRWNVTLDGQRIASNGRWVGRRTTEVVARSARAYEIVLPRFSAALVTMRMHAPTATYRADLRG